jgi:hypothetical protein
MWKLPFNVPPMKAVTNKNKDDNDDGAVKSLPSGKRVKVLRYSAASRNHIDDNDNDDVANRCKDFVPGSNVSLRQNSQNGSSSARGRYSK